MKRQEIYSVRDCLNKAKSALRQLEQDYERKDLDSLVFSAARVWLTRAEYAYQKKGLIRSDEFEGVDEYLFPADPVLGLAAWLVLEGWI